MTTMTVPEAMEKLAALGTAEHIALHFEEVGIRGFRQAVNVCPIANWVREQTGVAVRVNAESVIWEETVTEPDRWKEAYKAFGGTGSTIQRILHAESVSEFVRGFDMGQYPKLIDPTYGANMIGKMQAVLDAYLSSAVVGSTGNPYMWTLTDEPVSYITDDWAPVEKVALAAQCLPAGWETTALDSLAGDLHIAKTFCVSAA